LSVEILTIFMGKFGFGLREALVVGATAVVAPSVEHGPRGDREPTFTTVEVPESERMGAKNGDWQFVVEATAKLSLFGTKESTFYQWLAERLKKDLTFTELAEKDRAFFIDGFISLTRILNPNLNLDNFPSVKTEGVVLIFPIKVLAEPRPEKIFSKDQGGYSRLQELAIADGFPVDQADKQQETYEKALAAGEKMPTSPWFYLDRQGSEDSPAVLAPDVIKRLEDFGRTFSQLNFGGKIGWRICITDVMRDPVAQAKRNEVKGSTHTTGRSFDMPDGRFLTPEGTIITYSIFGSDGKPTGQKSNYAKMIETEMRPAIERLIGQYGLVGYREGSHWHVYAPKDRTINLSEEVETGLLATKVELKEISDKEREISIWEKIKNIFASEELVVEKPVDKVEYLTSAEVDAKLVELQPALQEIFAKKKVERLFLTIFKFPDFSPENRQTFSHLSYEELKKKTETWRLSDKESEQAKWRAISQAWVKDRTIEIVKRMSPEDVERLGVLYGSVLNEEGRPSFSNLRAIWEWKSENRTDSEAKDYVNAVLRLNLESLDHSMDVNAWREKQQANIDLLKNHTEKFGFRSEIMPYFTPEIMLTVIHAEFFSNLDARPFVETSSAFFKPFNIVFGPAVNDFRCSSGPVQLTENTFVTFLDNYSRKFLAIKAVEGDRAKFIVPTKIGEKKIQRNKKIVTVGSYNPDEFAQAMVGDAESILFYAGFSVADHTRLAFKTLFANEDFRKKWGKASEEDKLLFVGSLAPLAINGGGGTARLAAESMLVDKHLKTLKDMSDDMFTHTNRHLARRGAARGHETMLYFREKDKNK